MRFSKLIAVLHSLDKPYIKLLDKYLRCGYFKSTNPELALFTYLQKLPKSFSEEKLAPTAIGSKCAQLKKKSIQDKTATALLKSIEHFLALEEWQSNGQHTTLARLRALKKQHLFERFEESAQIYRQQLDKNTAQDIEIFEAQHLLAELQCSGFDAKGKRPAHTLDTVLDTLDVFHAVKKLTYIAEAIGRQEWFGTPAQTKATDALLHTLRDFSSPKYLYVLLLTETFQMLSATTYPEGEKHYRVLRQFVQQLDKQNKEVPSGAEFSLKAINFCLRWNNRGFTHAGKEYMWWVEWRIKHHLFLQKNLLQPIAFRNVVSIGLKSGYSLPWIKKFIDTYQHRLPKPLRENNVAYAQALYQYAAKNYTVAAYLFNKVEAKDEPIFNAQLRRWHFMSTYESRPDKLHLDSSLGTFEKYLLRHAGELHQFKPLFNRFVSYAKKLLQAKDKKARQRIYAQLSKEEFFPGKDWLEVQLRG